MFFTLSSIIHTRTIIRGIWSLFCLSYLMLEERVKNIR
jgi:hypothetical protein